MKMYRITIDAVIPAEDAGDAYGRLREHLGRLARHEWSDLVEPGSECAVDEVESQDLKIAWKHEERDATDGE